MNRTFVLRDEIAFSGMVAFVRANWQRMAADSRPLSVLVAEHKARRNGDQNRLYWALLREIARAAWVDGKQFSDEAWHSYFRARFIGYEDGPSGVQAPISTTTLSVAEFSAYIDRIQQYATVELGVEVTE